MLNIGRVKRVGVPSESSCSTQMPQSPHVTRAEVDVISPLAANEAMRRLAAATDLTGWLEAARIGGFDTPVCIPGSRINAEIPKRQMEPASAQSGRLAIGTENRSDYLRAAAASLIDWSGWVRC